jgi:hypothetical protein
MKITIREDFRVVVGPITPHGRLTDEQVAASLERQCREIKWQIERHVDGLGGVSVQWTTRAECSFCGLGWEEETAEGIAAYPDDFGPGDGPGLPVCCERAQVEWRAAQTAVTA